MKEDSPTSSKENMSDPVIEISTPSAGPSNALSNTKSPLIPAKRVTGRR